MVQSNGSCRGGVISNQGVEPSSLVCRLGQNIVSLNLRTFNMLFNSSMTKQRSTLIISRCLCVLVGGRESAWHLELFIKRHWSAVYYYFYSLNTLERVKVMIDDKIKHFFYCFKCVWCCCLILRPRQLCVSMLAVTVSISPCCRALNLGRPLVGGVQCFELGSCRQKYGFSVLNLWKRSCVLC